MSTRMKVESLPFPLQVSIASVIFLNQLQMNMEYRFLNEYETLRNCSIPYIVMILKHL